MRNPKAVALKERLTAIAGEAGFDIQEPFGEARKGKGAAAVKFRDPKTPENTWTCRGRPLRWLAATLKGGKAKKEGFLIRPRTDGPIGRVIKWT
ncbi:MAG: H-NS histone family protein [Hyphomicrobiaceae bacterium]